MKFKIYDKVWLLWGDRVREYTVYKRSEEATFVSKPDIQYRIGTLFENKEEWLKSPEECLFATKQELLDNL